MSNRRKGMEREYRIEGVLLIPPNRTIKNPIIKINHRIFIESGGPFLKSPTHKGVLIPSLSNCHAHLDINIPVFAENFTFWIAKIISHEKLSRNYSEASEKLVKASRSLGILSILDITKDRNCPLVKMGVTPFLEVTGSEIPEIPEGYMISPHAIYSTTPGLLKAVAERYPDKLKSIHVAESEEEIKFARGEKNLIEEIIYPLVGRTRSMGSYRSPVEYLAEVGLAGPKTLFVHCCFVDERDAEIIAKTGTHVCVCPRSNLYLSGKVAPVKKLLDKGVNVVLGTDSLGSSPNINLWEEARTLFLTQRNLSPLEILAMITVNPAKFTKRISGFLLFELEEKNPQDIAFHLLFQGDTLPKQIISLPSSPQLW